MLKRLINFLTGTDSEVEQLKREIELLQIKTDGQQRQLNGLIDAMELTAKALALQSEHTNSLNNTIVELGTQLQSKHVTTS